MHRPRTASDLKCSDILTPSDAAIGPSKIGGGVSDATAGSAGKLMDGWVP